MNGSTECIRGCLRPYSSLTGPIHVHMKVFQACPELVLDKDKLGNAGATPLYFFFAPVQKHNIQTEVKHNGRPRLSFSGLFSIRLFAPSSFDELF